MILVTINLCQIAMQDYFLILGMNQATLRLKKSEARKHLEKEILEIAKSKL